MCSDVLSGISLLLLLPDIGKLCFVVVPGGGASPLNASGELSRRLSAATVEAVVFLAGLIPAASLWAAAFAAAGVVAALAFRCKLILIFCQKRMVRAENGVLSTRGVLA